MKIKLGCGDCLELMKKIPDGIVDLVVTSPPYDNLRNYNDSLEWSFEIFTKIAKELKRVLKKGGVIVWVVSDATVKGSETGTSFKQALYFKDVCELSMYDTMIWLKPSPQAPTHNRYYDVFEYMFVFCKGAKPRRLNLLEDRKNISSGLVGNVESRSNREDRKRSSRKRVVGEYSRRFNVWGISRGRNKTKHPAVFPEALANDHIVSWSDEGDTVLDPFMGSGTTGKMSKINNRNFIGIEKDKDYFKIAKKRIEGAFDEIKSDKKK